MLDLFATFGHAFVLLHVLLTLNIAECLLLSRVHINEIKIITFFGHRLRILSRQYCSELSHCNYLSSSRYDITRIDKSLTSGQVFQMLTCFLLLHCRLNGVPMAYSGVKVQQDSGWLLDDYPHIHCNITANFVVFRPTVGAVVCGVVNKLGSGFVGCLVHGIFNASLVKSKNQSSSPTTSNCQPQLTRRSLNEVYSSLEVGSEVKFSIEDVHVNRQLLSLTGRLVSVISNR